MKPVDIELMHSVEEEQLRERPELASEPKFLRTPVSPRTFYALLSVAIDRAYKRFLGEVLGDAGGDCAIDAVVCGSGAYGLMRARILFGGTGADIRLG